MKIAIASGKGGTGKTTIATNLACSIARTDKEAQYLDCDVEEPNGHIFLKPNIEEMHNVTVGVPEVDTELCGGCELVCPTGAIKEKQVEIGFVDLGTAGDVKFGQGKLKIGDVRSPALIKKVKENTTNNNTVIIDAPPGLAGPHVEVLAEIAKLTSSQSFVTPWLMQIMLRK